MNLRLVLTPVLLIVAALALSSCSTSRIVNEEREFATGTIQEGSILQSDLYVASGATLDVAYLSGSRVFLESGATLRGLGKGVRESAIYAETGAIYPRHPQLRPFAVDDARRTYDNRFRELLPAGQQSSGQAVYSRTRVGVGVGIGGFGYNRFHRNRFRGRGFSSRGFSRSRARAVSVRPNSFRRR